MTLVNDVLAPVQVGRLVAAAPEDPWLGLPVSAFPVLVVHGHAPAFAGSRALVVPLGSMRGRVVTLADQIAGEVDRFILGRARGEADVLIEDLSISRRHAALVRKHDERWAIVDLGSMNGTFLGGKRLAIGQPAILGENEKQLAVGLGIELMILDRLLFPRAIYGLRTASDREMVSRTHAGQPVPASIAHGGDEYFASRILDAVRLAPFTPSVYDIIIDDLSVEAVHTWTDLVAAVGRLACRITRIEAHRPGGGEPFVVDLRVALDGRTTSIPVRVLSASVETADALAV